MACLSPPLTIPVVSRASRSIYPQLIIQLCPDKDQASLALGMKSSFLDTALQSHAVPSKQFSYWPGRDSYSEYNSIDGLLVIGGYDENRLASGTEIHEYKLTSNGEDEYRMFVEIKGLDWQYSANNSTSLLPEDSDTDTWFGVLDTSYKYVDLPFSSHEKFAVANNGTYNTTRGLYTYNNLQSYDGELVVTFVDGFQVKISADDLFEYPMEYEKTTGELDYAEYPPQLVDNIWQDYGTFSSPLGLGLPFLMSVLLVTDYDQDSFYLANANTDDRPRNVLPLCTGGPTSLDPMANATLGNNTSANGNNNSDGIHKSDTNVAAIAGGVGGGVGAVLILATLAFFFIRRRKQQQSAQHIPFLPEVSEQPHRGSTMSSPLKYMDANIYETNNSDHEERYRSPQSRSLDFVIPQLDRDRGNNSPWSTTVPANSTTDAGTDNQESGMGTHEMSSGNRFSATSGPVEMPSDFDYRP